MLSQVLKLTLGITVSFSVLVDGRLAAAAEVNCRTFVADFVSWNKAKRQVNAVGAKMATAKIRESNRTTYPWGHGSYSEGRFALHGDDLQGRFIVLFSDRKEPGGKYRFDPAKADIQDVTLYADGRIRILLRTWGDTSLFIGDVRCYSDGIATGILREGNGVSIVSLLLRKEIMREGDTFRDWP